MCLLFLFEYLYDQQDSCKCPKLCMTLGFCMQLNVVPSLYVHTENLKLNITHIRIKKIFIPYVAM